MQAFPFLHSFTTATSWLHRRVERSVPSVRTFRRYQAWLAVLIIGMLTLQVAAPLWAQPAEPGPQDLLPGGREGTALQGSQPMAAGLPQQPAIRTTATVTTGKTGCTASVGAQSGCSYNWSITGGIITAGATSSTLTYTAGAVGSLTLACQVSNSIGNSTGTTTVSVVAAPAITSFASTSSVLTAGTGTTLIGVFTGGTGSVDQGVGGIASGAQVAVQPSATTTYTLTVTNPAGTRVNSATTVKVVPAPTQPVVTAPAFVTTGQADCRASVPVQAGCTYAWIVAGGTITSGTSGTTVVFTAGTTGTLSLGCTVSNAAGAVSNPGTATVAVVPAPAITSFAGDPSVVTAGAGTNLVASFAGGTGAVNQGVGPVVSGAPAPVTPAATTSYTLTVTNPAGAKTTKATTVKVVAAPAQPVLTAPTYVTAGRAGYKASTPAQPGCSYAWTIAGGTLTAGATTPTAAFQAGDAGTLTLNCTVTNAAGTASTPGTIAVSVVPAPTITSFTAAKTVIASGASTDLTPVFSDGNGSVDQAVGTVTSTVPVTVSPSTTTRYTLTVTNPAGTAVTRSLTVNVAFPPMQPVLTVPANVTANQGGWVASVPEQAQCRYAWTITGGTITAGAGSASVTFAAGGSTTLSLSCTVINLLGDRSIPGTASVSVVATPGVPVLTAPANVTSGQGNYLASVTAQTGCTYVWSITGGTLTAGNGTPSIVFTAGAVGTLTLGCTVSNAAGTATTQTIAVQVVASPAIGGFSASPVTVTRGGSTTLVCQFTGGSGSVDQGVGAVTSGMPVTLSPTSTTTYTLTVINQAGSTVFQTLTVTVAAPVAQIPVTIPATVTAGQGGYQASVPAQNGAIYTWTIAGGSLTAGNGGNVATFAAGPLGPPRANHTANVLVNGQVLLAGGYDAQWNALASADLFDPATAGITATPGLMTTPRQYQSSASLPDGRVLVAGGDGSDGSPLATSELFLPTSGQFVPSGTLNAARDTFTATVLQNGQVLLAGGCGMQSVLGSLERFDPSTQVFSLLTTGLAVPRTSHTATLLNDGRVLIAGGQDANWNVLASAEWFDPVAGSCSLVGSSMIAARADHSATLLGNGQVLLVGGDGWSGGEAQPIAEIFDPVTGIFRATTGAPNVFRSCHTATLLANGTVLIAGGDDNNDQPLGVGEIYDPSTDLFTLVPTSMCIARSCHTASLLADGRVLLAGGDNSQTAALATPEIYDPVANAFVGSLSAVCSVQHPDGSLAQGRGYAVVMPNPAPVISVPAVVTGGSSYTASASTIESGVSYAWSLDNGTITSDPSQSSITFIPGSVGSLGLTCTTTPTAGSSSVGGTRTYTATVVAAPIIDSFTADHATLALGSSATLSAQFENGSGSVDQGVGPVASGVSFTVTPNTNTTYTLQVTNQAGTVVSQTLSILVFVLPLAPAVTAPTAVAANQGGFVASVQPQANCTYQWAIQGGTLLAGAENTTVTFASGPAGPLQITCTVTNPVGSASGTANVMVAAGGPGFPVITAPSRVITGASGIPASVPPQDGCSFLWTLAGGTLTSDPSASTVTFTVGALGLDRWGHTATLLNNGQILLAGGESTSQNGPTALADLFTPNSAGFSPTPSPMSLARYGHTATLLNNGMVLLAGGGNYESVWNNGDLFDPVSGQFIATAPPTIITPMVMKGVGTSVSAAAPAASTRAAALPEDTSGAGGSGNMTDGRIFHAASLLLDGTVLLTGGNNPRGATLETAECYNPTANQFILLPSTLSTPRAFHTSTLLQDGRVLLVGGMANQGFDDIGTADLFDPSTGSITQVTGTLASTRWEHSATLLANGQVLVVGGFDYNGNPLATAEIFDPSSGIFTPTAGLMTFPRAGHTATLLPDGTVLVAGGGDANGNSLAVGEIFDPTSGTFAPAQSPMLSARTLHSATLTPSGQVLLAGGTDTQSLALPSPEWYVPGTSQFIGTLGLMCSAIDASGTISGSALANAFVLPPQVAPVVTTCPSAYPGQIFTASVSPQVGAAYSWTAVNGTILSGGSQSNVTVEAGSAGTLTVTCTETDAMGHAQSGSASVAVLSVISAPALIAANQAGFIASVPSLAGATYSWSITNGQILAKVGTNSVLFASGNPGTLVIDCLCNSAGQTADCGPMVITVVQDPNSMVITAPSSVVATTYASASAPYWGQWGIMGGAAWGSSTGSSFAFFAGNTGNLTLWCNYQDSGGVWIAATTTVAVNPFSIVGPQFVTTQGRYSAYAQAASQTQGAWSVFQTWSISNGTIAGNLGNTGTYFYAGQPGTLTLTCSATFPNNATPVVAVKIITVLPSPVPPSITGPRYVTAQVADYTASCAIQPGCTYAWSISNGTITNGSNSPQVTFTPGTMGTSVLSCFATNQAGTTSSAGTWTMEVDPPPVAIITALPPAVSAGMTGLMASVPDQMPGCTYNWAVQGGTLLQSSGFLPTVIYEAGQGTTVNLSCTVTNRAGTSASGTLAVPVGLTPNADITAPVSAESEAAGLTAAVPFQVGASYAWTVSGGTITSSTNGSSIVFTAGTGSNLTLQCTVTNNGLSTVGQCTILLSSNAYYAYYSFDEGQGRLVLDHSGHGFNGTLQNNPQWVPGKTGQALAFDGASSYVTIPFLSPFQNPFSVSVWVIFGAVSRGVNNPILALGTPTGTDQGLELYESNGKIQFDTFNDVITSNATMPLNAWTHLLFVWDGTNRWIYVNGVLDTTAAAGAIQGTASTLVLGQESWAPKNTFLGTMDELKIFDKALTAADAAVLYAQAVNVLISPRNPTLAVGQSINFNAVVTGNTNTAVTWSTPDPGSGALVSSGTSATYTAPSSIPAEGSRYRIVAQSLADPTQSDTVWATVNWPVYVVPPQVSLPPNGSTTFQAMVTADGNPQLTWSVQESGGGTVTSGGQYTAPATPGVYHVFASIGDGSDQSSTSAVTVGTGNGVAGSGPILYLPFDEGQGSLTLDASGYNHAPGVLVNQPAWVQGKFNEGLDFSPNARVTLAPSLSLGDPWTISGWFVYPFPDSTHGHALVAGALVGDLPILVGADQVSLGMGQGNVYGHSPYVFWDSGFRLNTLGAGWHQIAAVGSGGSTQMYVDGVPVGNPLVWESQDYIGGVGNSLDDGDPLPFGYVDEVRIYNRALGAQELSGMFLGAANVTVQPATPVLVPGQSQAFTASVTGAAPGVTWELQGPAGASLTSGGVFTAPAELATNGTVFTVVVRSQVDPTQSASVPVTVNFPVAVSPAAATVPLNGSCVFTAVTTNLGSAGVTWSCSGGVIDSQGNYTAPAEGGQYTVTATSVADPTQSGSAQVYVPVTVTIQPTGAGILTGSQLAFTAQVAGSDDPDVSWSVVESLGGTISQSGVYQAPSQVGTFHVSATSQADPRAAGVAAVTVVPDVLYQVEPSYVSVAPGGMVKFRLTGVAASSLPVNWQVLGNGGDISSDGTYTAPPQPGTYMVLALFTSDVPRVATATVNVNANGMATVTVVVIPAQVTLAPNGTQQFSASVQGAGSSAVSWSCSGGTIDQTGLFTAPAAGGTYTVMAGSQAASGAVGEATVTVGPASGGGGTTSAPYQYDLNGNLLNDGARAFEWDAENRLVSVTINATGHRSEFGYDGMGRRVCIRELDPDQTQTLQVTSDTKYLWDGLQIAESRTSDGGTVLQRYYSQGFVDIDGTVLYYTRDHLGSIRELTDGTQAVRARYDYDPWGRPSLVQGDRIAPFQFTGHFWHAPSSLNLSMFRAYDPNLARWISRDPINDPKILQDNSMGPNVMMSFTPAELSQGPSLYGYCLDNPINDIDKLGLSCTLASWSTTRDNYSYWDTQTDISDAPMGDAFGLFTILCDVVVVDHWERYTSHTTQHFICRDDCGATHPEDRQTPAKTVEHVISTWVQFQNCKGMPNMNPVPITPRIGPGPTPPRSGFPGL